MLDETPIDTLRHKMELLHFQFQKALQSNNETYAKIVMEKISLYDKAIKILTI